MKLLFPSVFYFFTTLVLLFPLSSVSQSKKVINKAAATQTTNKLQKSTSATKQGAGLVFGKYSCTASKYQNGSYEFIPRGSFVLERNGSYTYKGFDQPSKGNFMVDKSGHLLFKGGYFDGGKAEKTDRPNKYLLVFPSNPDNRWTCSLAEK